LTSGGQRHIHLAKEPSAAAQKEDVPAVAGAYALELFEFEEPMVVVVGRLGRVTLPAGRLRYYGSAYGPGGLSAGIARHLRPAGRRTHWHVDTLTRRVSVAGIRYVADGSECKLVQQNLTAGWVVVVRGFGSSDCRKCAAHLLSSA
jgi:histidyl-tRNA synthetase